MELFDRAILPILTYGSEIWGYKEYKSIEQVQIKFLRRKLGLGQSTSVDAILGETGREPIAVHCHVKVLKFWFKIKNMDEHRYPKRCYIMLVKHDVSGRQNWVTNLRNMFIRFNCGYLWENQENITPDRYDHYIKLFREAAVCYYRNQCMRKIQNSAKLAIYATIKSLYGKEKYLQILTLKKSIQIMAKFRISNHELEIEQGRHEGILLAKRCCLVCEQHGRTVLEDEYHLLLHCSLYDDIRNRYLQTCWMEKRKILDYLSKSWLKKIKII